MSAFDRPIGAQADVNELEYISFLHQTSTDVTSDTNEKRNPNEVRTDCSINAQDIRIYLKSRYGIEVERAVVSGTILHGLGGGSGVSDVIDLMELASLLLIPALVKAAAVATNGDLTVDDDDDAHDLVGAAGTIGQHQQAPEQPPQRPTNNSPSSPSYISSLTNYFRRNKSDDMHDVDEADDDDVAAAANATATAYLQDARNASLLKHQTNHLFRFVSQMILHDTTGDGQSKPLTEEFLREILTLYGETELANDTDLIREMIRSATPGDQPREDELMFDARTFATGATFDTLNFDPTNEETMTTLLDEILPPPVSVVMKLPCLSHDRDDQVPQHPGGADPSRDGEQDLYATKRDFTAPAVDVTAGTYRSKPLIVMLWATAILHFCSYYFSQTSRLFEAQYCVESDLVYNTTVAALQEPWAANSAAILCETGVSVVEWLVLFLYIGVYGLAFTTVGSVGNTMDCRTWYHPVIGCIPVLLSCGIYFIWRDNSAIYILVLTVIGVFLSLIVMYLHLTHALSIIVSEDHLQRHPGIREYWLSEERIESWRLWLRPRLNEAEYLNKQAMSHKLGSMVENAVYIFSRMGRGADVIDTYNGRAVNAYSKRGIREYVPNAGGLTWTWTNIWNKHLFDREGIWFSVRVLASNIGQLTACFFVFWAGIYLMQYTIQNFGSSEEIKALVNDAIQQQIQQNQGQVLSANASSLFGEHLLDLEKSGTIQLNCSDYTSRYPDTYKFCTIDGETGVETCENTTSSSDSLCALSSSKTLTVQEQIHLLEQSGLDTDELNSFSEAAIKAAVDEAVDAMYPTQLYMVTVPVGVGIFFSSVTAVALTITYLASVTSTVLQLRCGVIPMLRNKNSVIYRVAPETVALLTGSIFWGCIAASVLNGLMLGFLSFLFMWQVTVFSMQRLLAIIIGLLAVTLFKLVFLMCFRSLAYSGYYRTKPLVANIAILALEWANFTLSAGIIIVRAFKLLLVAAFSIGRVYRPFLAPGIGWIGPIELDGYPTIHLREVLAHEAHRHPYIELLGYIYLMKLRYSDKFGKTAGTCWRIILVHALMPWLRKYRIIERDEDASLHDGPQFRNIRRTNATPRATGNNDRNNPGPSFEHHDQFPHHTNSSRRLATTLVEPLPVGPTNNEGGTLGAPDSSHPPTPQLSNRAVLETNPSDRGGSSLQLEGCDTPSTPGAGSLPALKEISRGVST